MSYQKITSNISETKSNRLHVFHRSTSDTIKHTQSTLQKHNSMCGDRPTQKLFESSSGNNPKTRVSSGSFFYGQVIAQQKVQATRDAATNVKNVCPDIKTQCASKVRDSFKVSMPPVILFVFCCQVFISIHLYILITTLKNQVRL